ncbi:VCBS domain-containing protein, partial [Kordiimonas marina]|uniref:VCBS domain-containing protein n=1 Tax=Kordiimonas marina TaxID=2872312 RepID=UPI001FF2D644
TFTVSSADGTTQDIVFTINGVNDAAVIGGTSTGSIGEDSTGTATGTLTVSDIDTGQSSFTADTIAGSYGTLTVTSNGDWSYDLDETLTGVQSLAAGDTLGDTITVASADGTTQDIVVTINGANDAPTAPVLSSSGVSEHSAGAFVGTLSATDPESSAVHFSVTDDRFRVEGDQLWLKDGVSLDYGKVASLTLQVFAADTSGLSSSTQVHISVLNVGEGAAETGTNGNDTLMGTGGSDTITGGAGNDTLDGGAGNDIIIKPASDQGQDTIVGGSGGDKIEAGGGSDFVVGGGASDGATRQTLVENSDPNVDGSDTIIGGTGDDTLLGGGWNDSLINDNGRYDEGEEVEAGTSQNRLWAGAGNDVAVGSGGNDVIGGNADNDYLKGLGGNDTLYGNSGDDTLKGGNGDDLLYNGQGNDSVEGGNGNDTLWAGAGNDTLIGGDGADSFVFGHHAGDDVITDFDMSQDSLDLHLRGITSAAALTDSASAATISGQAGLLIDLGNGESVFLVGLSIGDIEGINLVGA